MHQLNLNNFPTVKQYNNTKWWDRDGCYTSSYFRIKEYINKEDGLKIISKSYTVYGSKITTSSKRLTLILNGKHKCVCCSAELSHFHIERARYDITGAFYLAPYATLANGKEVLLTWDHKIPRALGGSDHFDNSQIMCVKCNNEKGSQADALIAEIIKKTPHLITKDRLNKALKKNKNNLSIINTIAVIKQIIDNMEK
jgi:5-methylcytosine-specific restriction endonuclease McrA